MKIAQVIFASLDLLKLIRAYFGDTGRLGKFAQDAHAFRVTSIAQIVQYIIPRGAGGHPQSSNDARGHFDQYPLITMKRADYII